MEHSLNAEEMAKALMIKNLTDKVPDVLAYTHLLYFLKEGTVLTMKTDRLPSEIVEKISKAF